MFRCSGQKELGPVLVEGARFSSVELKHKKEAR
jgi:hypothetical protein